jgi:hypothetical protein
VFLQQIAGMYSIIFKEPRSCGGFVYEAAVPPLATKALAAGEGGGEEKVQLLRFLDPALDGVSDQHHASAAM